MRIVIAAGGTGGHIVPGIAVAKALQKKGPVEILFVGIGGREAEDKVLSGEDFERETLPFVPVTGGGVLGFFRMILAFPRAVLDGVKLLRRFRADLVIGFGGYPSFVPLVAAFFLGIPRALQEQNVKVGLANKFLSLIVHKVFAVPGAKGFWRSGHVKDIPNPVRAAFTQIQNLPSSEQKKVVLVLGGSQGAVSVNSAVLGAIEVFKKYGVFVLHQTGVRDEERVRSEFQKHGFSSQAEVFSFRDDVDKLLSRASLVISRAGALSIAEISASGKPAIYIPLPIASGHQRENARELESLGGAYILEQDEQLGEHLISTLEELFSSEAKLKEMAQITAFYGKRSFDAADEIAEDCMSLL